MFKNDEESGDPDTDYDYDTDDSDEVFVIDLYLKNNSVIFISRGKVMMMVSAATPTPSGSICSFQATSSLCRPAG